MMMIATPTTQSYLEMQVARVSIRVDDTTVVPMALCVKDNFVQWAHVARRVSSLVLDDDDGQDLDGT
jgi:hypothetical protein